MEVIKFSYTQDEYNDGEIYISRREVNVEHDTGQAATLGEVLESFKGFLSAIGYLDYSVNQVQLVKPEAANEESI